MSSFKENIRKMYVFGFFNSLQFVSGVFVLFFLEFGKISFGQIMILQSFYSISVFLLETPTGALGDYIGRRKSLLLGAIFLAVGSLVYASCPNFFIFLLGELIFAFGTAFTSGSDQALLYDSLKKTRKERLSKKVFGRFSSFELFALMLSGIIGSFIASYFGLRYAMLLMFVPFSIAALISLSLKETKTRKKHSKKNYFKILMRGIRYFKNHEILKVMAFDMISVGVMVSFIFWAYQLILKQLGLPLYYFGFVFAALMLLEIFVINNFEFLEKIAGSKKKYLVYSAILPGICFILLGFVDSIILSIILILLTTSFGMSRSVLFRSYMNKFISSEMRATVLSTISMLRLLAYGIVTPLLGFMAEWSMKYTLITIGIILIAIAITTKIEENHLIH